MQARTPARTTHCGACTKFVCEHRNEGDFGRLRLQTGPLRDGLGIRGCFARWSGRGAGPHVGVCRRLPPPPQPSFRTDNVRSESVVQSVASLVPYIGPCGLVAEVRLQLLTQHPNRGDLHAQQALAPRAPRSFPCGVVNRPPVAAADSPRQGWHSRIGLGVALRDPGSEPRNVRDYRQLGLPDREAGTLVLIVPQAGAVLT
eukprot:scaffold1439_cov404-Prasinococcus_capsulatus_cf.AAC.68